MNSKIKKLIEQLERDNEAPLTQREYDYLEQIKTVDDVKNYTVDHDLMSALAYDAALAMGLSRKQAEQIAGDTVEQQPAKQEYQSMDISSGLGIGGYGSDDYNIWTSGDTISHPERDGCKWGGTRYDEACANCGRITAICNDCELCEKCHG